MIDLIPDPESDRSVLPLFTAYRESAHLAFPPPPSDLVTGQGRRRSRSRLVALSAAAAVVAAAVGTTVVLGPRSAHTPDPGQRRTPSPSASASPAPSVSPSTPTEPGGTSGSGSSNDAGQQANRRHPPGTVPPTALLTLDDLGPGYRVSGHTSEGDWRYGAVTEMVCRGVVGKKLGAQPNVSSGHRKVFFEPTDGVGPGVLEGVDGYLDGGAPRAAEYYRGAFAACAQFQTADTRYTLRILDTGFAGDDSMLVLLTTTANGSSTSDQYLHAFVWVGDLGAEIAFPNPTAVAWAEVVTQRAAARLSAG